MKILLLTVGTINYNCDINFFEPLKDMGYEVIRYNYIERLNLIGKRKMNKEILQLVKSENQDYVFYITYRDELFQETLRKLNQKGHEVVGWFSDDHWRFDNYSKFVARNLFCSITTDNEAFTKYKSNNLNVIKSQWAANTKYYHPMPSTKKYDVTFVGQKYRPRGEIIEYLRRNFIPIEAFGKGWGNYVPFEEIISIFSNSKINLNISASSSDVKIKQIKGRVFEIPMCGGFLLTDYVDKLENYFDIGKEIVCYEDKRDLANKITYYLKNEKEREKIAMNGYHASLERHSWYSRFRDIFKNLDLLDIRRVGNEGVFTKLKNLLYG